MLRMFSITLHVLCQTISITLDSFVNWTCKKILQCKFLIQKLSWTSDEGFKIAWYVVPHTWYFHGIQIWRSGYCSFSITCRQFLWRPCWEAHAMHAEPCWICHSRLAAVSCTLQWLWKQKLTNNFSYCLRTITTKITSLSCKAAITFYWNKRELVNWKLHVQNPSGSCI